MYIFHFRSVKLLRKTILYRVLCVFFAVGAYKLKTKLKTAQERIATKITIQMYTHYIVVLYNTYIHIYIYIHRHCAIALFYNTILKYISSQYTIYIYIFMFEQRILALYYSKLLAKNWRPVFSRSLASGHIYFVILYRRIFDAVSGRRRYIVILLTNIRPGRRSPRRGKNGFRQR